VNQPRRFTREILLISFAPLILEISYTRLISFKVYDDYTYLIIGLALLWIGSHGVILAISPRLRRGELERVLAVGCPAGAVAVGVGTLNVGSPEEEPFNAHLLDGIQLRPIRPGHGRRPEMMGMGV